MAQKVSVSLAHPYKDKQPGDVVSLDADEAKRLIRAGYAVPAKASDAKSVGADPATAASRSDTGSKS